MRLGDPSTGYALTATLDNERLLPPMWPMTHAAVGVRLHLELLSKPTMLRRAAYRPSSPDDG